MPVGKPGKTKALHAGLCCPQFVELSFRRSRWVCDVRDCYLVHCLASNSWFDALFLTQLIPRYLHDSFSFVQVLPV